MTDADRDAAIAKLAEMQKVITASMLGHILSMEECAALISQQNAIQQQFAQEDAK